MHMRPGNDPLIQSGKGIRSAMLLLFLLLAFTGFQPLRAQLFEDALSSGADAQHGAPSWMGGFTRTALFIGNTEEDGFLSQSVYGQFGLAMDLPLGTFGRGVADLRFRYGNEYGEQITEQDLREAYTEVFAGPVTLTLGKQITTVGKTSFINPSDQLTPMNPLFRSPDPDDLLLGSWMARAALNISEGSMVELVWLPLYTPSVLLTNGVSFPAYVTLGPLEDPGLQLDKSGLGLRYDLRTSLLDLDALYFHGYRNTPGIQFSGASLDPVTFQPENIQLYQIAYRINQAGFNTAIPAGTFIFRLEGSWMEPTAGDEDDPAIPFSEFSYAAELEQSGAAVTFIAGYFGKYILGFTAPVVESTALSGEFPDPTGFFPPGTIPDASMLNDFTSEQVAWFNRLYNYQLEEAYHSVYAIASAEMLNERLTFEIPFMYNITSKETTFRPSVTYSITDGLGIKTGLMLMRGPEDSLFDLVGPGLNAWYISVKTEI